MSFLQMRTSKVLLGALPFIVLLVFWLLVTASGWVSLIFLPSAPSVVQALLSVFRHDLYLVDIWISVYRVMAAFAISALFAIPLGLIAGQNQGVAALIEPTVGFVRYLPVPAFVPLCILWFGLGDMAKIVVIFLGTFFQLVLLIEDVSRAIPKDYFEAALTLGADRRHLIWRILWPASLPGVVSACRTAVG